MSAFGIPGASAAEDAMRVRVNVVQGRRPPQTLELDVATAEEAVNHAIKLGYSVLSVRSLHLSGAGSGLVRTKANRIDVNVFIEQLRDLLLAGLGVIESLDALRRGARGESVGTIEHLVRQLREGKILSDALGANQIFPPLLVALVRASELTSDLPQALSRFLEHEQRVAEVRHRVVSTSIYPLLLIAIGALVLLFLAFYVMPRFARVFEGMTGNLPWSAHAMVAWAHTLRDNSASWIAGASCVVTLILGLALSPKLRSIALRRCLASPFLQVRLHTYFLARWYRATGMLVQGGIPLSQALRLSSTLLPAAMTPGGLLVEQGVREGLAPSEAHVRAGMATPIAEQLMLAGERTGDLGAVLTRIAHFHEAEVSRALERTMKAIEPLVMVFIGLGVGAVVVLMYMPIFELASAIQ